MSRFSKIILFAAALAMAAACGDNAKVEGTLAQAPSAKLVVKSLNHVIDTVQTNADGASRSRWTWLKDSRSLCISTMEI